MTSKKQIKDTFFDLIKIDSVSGEETKVAFYIKRYLKRIGVDASQDKFGNVIARLDGYGEFLALCAHMDTVEPGRGIEPVVKNDIVRSKGETILGADDKASITEILEAVKYLKIKNIKHRPIELIFTCGEEKYFAGSINLNYKKISSKDLIVLDHSMPPGAIIMKSPFIYNFEIKIKGKSAHAGDVPEKGVNAIKVTGDAISELKIGRINKTTTLNIGEIKGGIGINTVPEEVYIKGEVRAYNQDSALRQIDLVSKAFKKSSRKHKARYYFKSSLKCPGYRHLRTNSLIKEIVLVNKELGINSKFIDNAASDANIFNKKGLNSVVISKGGSNPHSIRESIKITHMQKMISFLVEICT